MEHIVRIYHTNVQCYKFLRINQGVFNFSAFPPEKQEMKRVYDTANFYHFVHTMVRNNLIFIKLSAYAASFAPQEITNVGLMMILDIAV